MISVQQNHALQTFDFQISWRAYFRALILLHNGMKVAPFEAKRHRQKHNSHYVVFLFLHHKSQSLDLSAVFGAGGHNIDPCGINAAVSQNIRQLCNVLLDAIKGSGKELAQIVGKNLGRVDAG